MAEDPVVFNHVGLCVADIDRARNFYEQALDFRYWWELEAPDEPSSVLLQVPHSVPDMGSALDRVIAHGGQVLDQTDVKAAIMVRDPDGQLVELTTSDWPTTLPPFPG
jgi:catechol 2,3-dioxygenase-like lactoylglutathione lyase family enzyme